MTKYAETGIKGIINWSDQENIANWQNLQYGMFIHWGLYSELGGEWQGEPVKKGYSEQIQMWADISEEDYKEVAKKFSAENYDPKAICQLAKDAGMKYIVITSKHHDGFSLFGTDTTDYNLVQMTPFAKDAIKMLAEECENYGLKFGLYYSLVDWHQGHEFNHQNNNTINDHIEGVIENQLRELLTDYGPIAEVWFDMSSPTLAQSEKFAGIVRELQPDACINGRIWNNKGDFRTLADNQVPEISLEGAWQTPASIYRETWGYRNWQERNDFDGKVKDLTHTLVSVIARGGNYLLNIGPKGDGSILPFEAEVLEEIGKWVKRHPEAAVGAKPTKIKEQEWGVATLQGQDLYLHIKNWPDSGVIKLPNLVTGVEKVEEDSSFMELGWSVEDYTLTIQLPQEPADDILPVVKVTLVDQLYIIPEKAAYPAEKGHWKLSSEDLDLGYSYADKGHYFSLYETKVKLSAYLATEGEESPVTIKIKAAVKEDERYLISLGNKKVTVLGKDLQNIEGLHLPKDKKIAELEITLADPSFANEDLQLEVESITIEK